MAYFKIATMHSGSIQIIFLLVISIYFFIFLFIFIGWLKLRDTKSDVYFAPIKISVIIAARNESRSIPFLLNDLYQQDYPAEFFDIIIVDDHSDQRLSDLEQLKAYPGENLIVLDLPENKEGKKQALLEGVKHSHSELVLFTDADCRIGPKWIQSFVQQYNLKSSTLLFGLVDYEHRSGFLHSFFRADLLSLVVSGAGTASMGFATICNGANIAIRRSVFLEHAKDLKMHITTGDDVFLLHVAKDKYKRNISVIKNRTGIVTTKPPENIAEFFSQRARWASKGTAYKDPDTLSLALLVLLTNFTLVLVFILCTSGIIHIWNAIALYLIKTIADSLILIAGFYYFGGKKTILLVPVYELIYPIYILIATLMGILHLFTWKNR